MLLLRRRKRARTRGQALVEFALTIPIFLALLLGIVQFGLILWSQVTISQVARDAGRWAATQQNCTAAVLDSGVQTQVTTLARNASLYGSGPVTSTTQVEPGRTGCPPPDNTQVYWVKVTVTHDIPMFLPGLPSSWTVSSSARYRMEPAP